MTVLLCHRIKSTYRVSHAVLFITILFLSYISLYSQIEYESSKESLFRNLRFLHIDVICRVFITILILGSSSRSLYHKIKIKILTNFKPITFATHLKIITINEHLESTKKFITTREHSEPTQKFITTRKPSKSISSQHHTIS